LKDKTWHDRELLSRLTKQIRNYPAPLKDSKFAFKPDLSKKLQKPPDATPIHITEAYRAPTLTDWFSKPLFRTA
jgi:hypothetical protein